MSVTAALPARSVSAAALSAPRSVLHAVPITTTTVNQLLRIRFRRFVRVIGVWPA
jgi:hypothetical protein